MSNIILSPITLANELKDQKAVRFDKGHKEATRQRIIEAAAERFRKDGMAAVGIAGLMADAGLTHGGFYAHFESKEDLLREALAAASDATRQRLTRAAQRNAAGLEGLIRFYLRPEHRDTPAQGCAVSALVPEIARQSETTRAEFTKRLETFLALIAAQLPEIVPAARRQATAIGIFGVLLGTLQLARAVTNPDLSDNILESGITAALRLGEIA
jgi:TetR/AcrR family transcriptional repressor of nem operon